MEIMKIKEGKKKYLDLLLLADEQESMIDRYLERGEMYIINDNGIKSVCVVTKEDEGIYEIKNIAVSAESQGKGYGHKMLEYIKNEYKSICKELYVGTGDNEKTLRFYRNNGFKDSHKVKNFFTDNYDHEIYEDGKQLIDMIYLKYEYNEGLG
jgi:ribosomal protein S18 acetylase RimI-like enzyme